MGVRQKKPENAGMQFLRTGKIDGIKAAELAALCSRIVRRETEISSDRAIELGRAFVKYARPHGGILLQSAYRAYGWALQGGGKFRQAERTYLKARALVRNNPMLRAGVDRALIDVYMYLGNFSKARRHARISLATFTRLKADDDAAKTRVNYANLLHRQDRHREAQRLYNEAGEHFAAKQDLLSAAFCIYNQANTHVQLFDFKPANALYRKAEKIFKKRQHDLHANGCRYGLAWLHMLEGKYHVALKELADCEDQYQSAGRPREVVLCKLDRAEAYLGLNLYPDAKRVAADAELLARRLGIQYEASKGALFLAKALLAMGKTGPARRALRRAESGFKRERNDGFLATVELTVARLENNLASRPDRIRTARKRFARSQLPLWEAICDLQILSEWPDDRSVLKRLAKNPAVSSVPHLLARWHTVQGDRQARRGRLKAATDHWYRACGVLDAVRANLPPIDMRTAFLRDQGDPYCRMVQREIDHNPAMAAAWSERYKTVGLWQTDDFMVRSNPVREKAEKSLSALARQVTVLSGKIDIPGRKQRESSTQAAKALATLQERVRQDLAAIDTSAKTRVREIESVYDQIYEAARQHPILQFHAGSHDLVAFVHYKKRTHVHRYSDGIRIARELMDRWRFLVERAPFVGDIPSRSELEDERILLGQIGEWLLPPLELSAGWKRLLIVPEGGITNFPWQAIIYRGQPLAHQYELLLVPSIQHFLHARGKVTRSKKIEVFVGRTEDLPLAGEEARLFVQAGRNQTLVHDPCRREDWPDKSSAAVWHYTGHATLRRDNPFYSALMLDDGPIFAADFRLKKNIVHLVTLAACRTGQQAFLPGEESTGLVRSLMEMGARNVLASQWAISDASTMLWMKEFYSRFLAGEPIPSAVRTTALQIRNKYPSSFHWAAFSVFGAG